MNLSKTIILIIGTPSSGTTYVADLVRQMGASLPPGASETSMLEPNELATMADWGDDFDARLDVFMATLPSPCVVKHPTASFFWHRIEVAANRAGFFLMPVICTRRKTEVCKSYIATSDGLIVSTRKRLDSLLCGFTAQESAALQIIEKYPFTPIISFDWIYNQPEVVVRKLHDYLGGIWGMHDLETVPLPQPRHFESSCEDELKELLLAHFSQLDKVSHVV